MTPPQATPLILRSDLDAKINTKTNAATDNAILAKIIEESDRLQLWCSRRFDEFVETYKYTALDERQNGDLQGGELVLDDDLRSVITLTNGNAAVIDPGLINLLPLRSSPKTRIKPILTSGWRFTYSVDPVGAISVKAKWGYGGQWVSTGITVTTGLASSAGAASFTASAALETGMMLKLDDEYCYVNGLSGTGNSVAAIDRACNGSDAAVHANGTAIYRWEAAPIVQRLMTRLVLISIEQDSSPLFSALILADTSIPVASDGNPKDVLYDVLKAGLGKAQRITAG